MLVSERVDSSVENSFLSIENSGDLEFFKEHLQFSEDFINRTEINACVRNSLIQQLDYIKTRFTSSRLKLAVIGEFSSGKSTFINALLQEELLVTSAKVATGTATYISPGKATEVEVKFKNGYTLKRRETGHFQINSAQISSCEESGYDIPDVKKFIQQVTANEQITKDVAGVTITHPSRFLTNDILIIDTPGTNSTDPEHIATTTHILEQEADVILIIIPATQPFSQSLSSFLDATVRSYLHRTMFVVSRMDQIRVKEQEGLLSDLQARISNHFDISFPKVYPCSAQVFLDKLCNEVEIPNKILSWAEKFEDLEKVILDRLHRGRDIYIAESSLDVLSQIFDQLEEQMRSHWLQNDQNKATIEKEVIPDLTEFYDDQYHICHQIIKQAGLEAQVEIQKFLNHIREGSLSIIENSIISAEGWDALNHAIKSGTEESLMSQLKVLKEEVEEKAKKLTNSGKEATQFFDKEFSEIHKNNEIFEKSVNTYQYQTRNDFKWKTSKIFSPIKTQNEELDNADGKLALGGAAAGAAIGTGLLPGVGTVIGALVGFASSGMFSPSFEKRKAQFWDSLKPELESYFDDIDSQVKNYFDELVTQIEKDLDSHVNTCFKGYDETISRIVERQNKELDKLILMQEKMEKSLHEINQRRQSLVRHKALLVNTDLI